MFRIVRLAILVLVTLISVGCCATAPTPMPLLRAHAHNDYHHSRPLVDALAHGFCSVEADIFLVDGELLVAHDIEDVHPDRTLRALYLEPLRNRAKQFGGRIYPKGPPVTLLIDIKSEAEPTFAVLEQQLAEYSDIIDVYDPARPNAKRNKPVIAIVSGDRPRELMLQRPRYVARYDGRMSDLDSGLSPHFMPLVSDSWQRHFKWKGEGEMPAEERAKLHDMVQRAHAAGYRVRFWATPDVESVWQELLDANVDLINADNLPKLQAFLLNR